MSDTAVCYWLEPTGQLRRSLRRYVSGASTCPIHGYHNVHYYLDEVPAEWVERDYGQGVVKHYADWIHEGPSDDDVRWPMHCDCGYTFQAQDKRQLFTEELWKKSDGTIVTLRDAEPGAMWNAAWMAKWHRGPDGMCLVVKLPNGLDWVIDDWASNCGLVKEVAPGQGRQFTGRDDQKCWQRVGTPPKITVIRQSCPHCGVGGGSIQSGNWHGFLTDGVLHP